VLASLKRVANHGEVERVRRADVDGIDGGIFEKLVVIGAGLIDVKFVAELFGLFDVAFADGVDVHEAQAANAFEVDAADEAGAENCGIETVHDGL
jgi:hypothetical protein